MKTGRAKTIYKLIKVGIEGIMNWRDPIPEEVTKLPWKILNFRHFIFCIVYAMYILKDKSKRIGN